MYIRLNCLWNQNCDFATVEDHKARHLVASGGCWGCCGLKRISCHNIPEGLEKNPHIRLKYVATEEQGQEKLVESLSFIIGLFFCETVGRQNARRLLQRPAWTCQGRICTHSKVIPLKSFLKMTNRFWLFDLQHSWRSNSYAKLKKEF